MKRVLTVLLAIMLGVSLLVFPASAAHMGLKASSATLNRGDKFTVTVNLDNSKKVGSGGIVLNFDKSVFQITGGTCHVADATLSQVSASKSGGVFALAENRVVSGKIFTIELKVKADAPFGSYTVSGNANLGGVSCTAGSVSVKVECSHDFSAWTKVSGENHKRTCSICEKEEVAGHNWNSGTTVKAANCTTEGLKTYKCTDCGFTRDEVLPKNNSHNYTGWQRVDQNSHKGKCTRCGKTATEDHAWNKGTVTLEPTCTTEGSKDVKCTLCGEAQTQVMEKTEHPFGAFVSDDDTSHKRTCTACGLEDTVPHTFQGRYTHDAAQHHLMCSECDFIRESAAHIPGPEATKEEPQVCTVCSRVLRPSLDHVHSYDESWIVDEQAHWYACTGCGSAIDQSFHVYDNHCDSTCNICGFTRTAPHNFLQEPVSDESAHWYPCADCGEKTGYAPHEPGQEASIRSAQYCTVCGLELVPRVDHPHEFSQVCHYHRCECGDVTQITDEENCPICAADFQVQLRRFPWWIVCAAQLLVIVVLAVLLLVKKRRKTPPEPPQTQPEPPKPAPKVPDMPPLELEA